MKRCFAGINPWCGSIPQNRLKIRWFILFIFSIQSYDLTMVISLANTGFSLFDFDSFTMLLLTITINCRNQTQYKVISEISKRL